MAENNHKPMKRTRRFPELLFEMLEAAEQHSDMKCVVSWLPCGSRFQIHNRSVFVNTVLPRYFENTKYKSFIRQLNLYKFHRCSVGNKQRVRGAYGHPKFQRDRPDLLAELKRDSSIFNKEVKHSSSSISSMGSVEDSPQQHNSKKYPTASELGNKKNHLGNGGLYHMLTWARSEQLLQPFSLLDCQVSPPKDDILKEIVKTFGTRSTFCARSYHQHRNVGSSMIAGGLSS